MDKYKNIDEIKEMIQLVQHTTSSQKKLMKIKNNRGALCSPILFICIL